MIGYNLPDDVDEAELARYMREKKPPCSNCDKTEAKAKRYRRALENIKALADSFGADHPMPQSTWAMAMEAQKSLKEESGAKGKKK